KKSLANTEFVGDIQKFGTYRNSVCTENRIYRNSDIPEIGECVESVGTTEFRQDLSSILRQVKTVDLKDLKDLKI
ncbi:MAG: hypothetical protein LUH49_04455, partial [Cloacibacillus porcorum]|uniref:hypothetical protein n=1 Tax=Cloacibacillus porcorum TaxID=1197717 RepID=UPI0023F0D9F6